MNGAPPLSFETLAALATAAPVLTLHDTTPHAAHYQYGAGGHDLERWVVRSQVQPTREQLDALGLPSDAEYHVGFVEQGTGRQHWVYVARRPLSEGTCNTCRAAASARLFAARGLS